MEQVQVGKIISGSEERDAIHIAIAPVEAGEILAPGQRVMIKNGKAVSTRDDGVGIVDPFLMGRVFEGDWFYLFLDPGTVTGMRHEWDHPVFQEAPEIKKVRPVDPVEWLSEFADKAGMDYGDLLARVMDFVENGTVWVEQSSETARNAWYSLDDDDVNRFWIHFESVTGVKRAASGPDDWAVPFSCSC